MGPKMHLGDVTHRTVPKMTLLAEPRNGGAISSRTFIPHRCHASVGVLGAVSIATACLIPNTVAEEVARISDTPSQRVSVEHPTGEFSVLLQLEGQHIAGCGLLRTARLIFEGQVAISGTIWPQGM